MTRTPASLLQHLDAHEPVARQPEHPPPAGPVAPPRDIQRDVRDLTRIRRLGALPRLLTLAAGQTARLLNVSELSGPFQISRQTIREYVTLLARLFVLEELPPWHSNRRTRLIRTPKLHLGDTGL